MNLLILHGTKRRENKSGEVADYLAEYLAEHKDLVVKLIKPQDIDLNPTVNDKLPVFNEGLAWADGLFIVTPEYNHSFPGTLKHVLDSEMDLYKRKPVAICGVSSGSFGGVRAIELLLPVVRRLGLVVLRNDLYVPDVGQSFKKGRPVDDDFNQRVDQLMEEFLWMAEVLKEARQTKP